MKNVYILKYEKLTWDRGIFDGNVGIIFLNKEDAEEELENLKECTMTVDNARIEEIPLEKLNKMRFEF